MSSTVELPRATYARYLLVALAVIVAILVGAGSATSALNPLVYRQQSIAQVAQDMVDGKNYANYDPNVDFRSLRREQIRRMRTTPDVVIFGGSRWQEAHADLIPGKTVFNAYVSNDQLEDMMAIAYLLDEAGRLPKTLILSERFITFQPLAQRDTYDWLVWAPEYRAMAARLGITPYSRLATLPIKRWTGLFYLPALFDRVQQVGTSPHAPYATSAAKTDDLDVLSADGSLQWSRRSDARYTKPFVDKLVKSQLAKLAGTAPAVEPRLVDELGKTIDFLRAKGVRVVMVQTPYHPAFYAGIQGKPFLGALNRLQSVADEMSRRHGAVSAGGFDPATFGCTPDQFIDEVHPKPSCLGAVLRAVPGLVQGGRS